MLNYYWEGPKTLKTGLCIKQNVGHHEHFMPYISFQSLHMMLDFIERGCKKIRPHYEGVVILAHNKEMLKHLMAPILTDLVNPKPCFTFAVLPLLCSKTGK